MLYPSTCSLLLAFAAPALGLTASAHRHPALAVAAAPRSAVTCVAKTAEDKALLTSSRKVVTIAKTFGVAQGKAAQAWVEQAVQGGDARTDSLISMQLALFEECSLDDTSGKCKQLTAAMEAMTDAVEARKERSDFFSKGILAAPWEKGASLALQFGETPIQSAANKLRGAASKFGPEQKAAADAWIKKVGSGNTSDGLSLLSEQITLFGECTLSNDGTPTNCQQLEQALEAFQDALEANNIEALTRNSAPVKAETDMEYRKRMARGGK